MKISNLKSIKNTVERSIHPKLDNVTFFITSICNLRCKYCFNASALGRKDDLSVEEIKKIFNHFDSVKGMILSGGEPYLRNDLYEIMDYFIKDRGMVSFGIPSNCVSSQNTLEKTEYLVKKYPQVGFVLCCSLDPTEELHDRLRGPGIYKRVLETAKELSRMTQKYSNLSLLINSVVTKEAIPSLDHFVDFIYKEIKPTLHSLDIVRTSTKEDKEALANFTKDDYSIIMGARLKLDSLYKAGDILLPVYKLRTKILTKSQVSSIENTGKWPTPCLAGLSRVVLDANGNFRLCENRPVLGNLRDYDYDYKKLMATAKVTDMLNDIKEHACDCNHIVTLRESIEAQFPVAVFHYFLSISPR